MATIRDVAKLAKVSEMTVSRVINNSSHVSILTRNIVKEAIKELNYRPNLIAKGLVTGRNRLIMYIVSDLSDPFFGLVSKGVENACFNRGYTVSIVDASSKQRFIDCLDVMIDLQFSGAIIHHLEVTDSQVNSLKAVNVECVMIDNESLLANVSNIESDNENGGRIAALHLLEKGHRKIALVKGGVSSKELDFFEYIDQFQKRIWQERTSGFEKSLRKWHLSPIAIFSGSGTMRFGFPMAQSFVREILAMHHQPTAIYCENDILALGVLSELLEKSIDVPKKIAVIGHDGLEMCTMLFPRITTIEQPRYEIGFTAATQLMDQIEGKSGVKNHRFESVLFQGDTT